ncbi:MAG: FMN-binding protein [Candidatus Marinimicrobia bacterium]|nr:FMN-binding protein [Candidatus Neomarinimicrobiota bacterium]
MKKSTNLIIVLTTTAIISGLVLASLDNVTQPIIEAHASEVLKNAVTNVLPGIESYDREIKEGVEFFLGKNLNGTIQNVAFQAVGNGFQSKLKILVGMDLEMKTILAIKVLEQMETPGLGTKIETDPSDKKNPGWFYKQFFGLNLAKEKISYLKNETPNKEKGQIMAITGATISSQAVVDIINDAIIKNRKIFLKQG